MSQQYPPQQQYGQPYPQQPQGAPPRRKRHIARNILAGIGAVAVAIIVIAAAASGGRHTVNTTGTVNATGTNRGNTASPAAEKASAGSSITLAGNNSGEQMSVTVTKVITSARGSDEFSQPPAGDRLYAVQFRLRDTGSAAYSDAPSNGATVTDSKGQSYQSGIEDVAGCQSFPGTENIAPGASGLGCIVFEVPKTAVITQVQFTLDSGFGPQTGQWNVKS